LTFVGTGEAAVEAVKTGDCDVVVMDVELSGIDGLEAARRIRALPAPAGAVPIIGLSGHTAQDDAAAALLAGMDVYLRKPATPAELNDALSQVAVESGSRRDRSDGQSRGQSRGEKRGPARRRQGRRAAPD